jgi:hypothetical protein
MKIQGVAKTENYIKQNLKKIIFCFFFFHTILRFFL